MVAYWVAVGVGSTVQLWVWYRHRWLVDLARRLPLYTLVLGWAGLSTLWSLEPLFTAGRAAALYFEAVFGIFIGFAFRPKDVMALLTWTFAGLLILNVGCALLLPEQGVQSLGWSGPPVWKGITINRNQLGALAAGAAAFFEVALLRRRLPWLPALGFVLLGAGVVYMTRSATALILLVTFTPLTMLLVGAKCLRKTYALVAALVVAAVVGFWYLAADLDKVTLLVDRDPSLTGRTAIWHEAGDLIRHRPLTGWGFNMVWGHRQASWFPDLPWTVRAYHAHNGYVQLAAELGLPAAALAGLMVLILTVRAFLTYVASGSAFALFCSLYFAMFAVGNLTESKLFFLLWPEWTIFTALAVAFERSRAAAANRALARSPALRTGTCGPRPRLTAALENRHVGLAEEPR